MFSVFAFFPYVKNIVTNRLTSSSSVVGVDHPRHMRMSVQRWIDWMPLLVVPARRGRVNGIDGQVDPLMPVLVDGSRRHVDVERIRIIQRRYRMNIHRPNKVSAAVVDLVIRIIVTPDGLESCVSSGIFIRLRWRRSAANHHRPLLLKRLSVSDGVVISLTGRLHTGPQRPRRHDGGRRIVRNGRLLRSSRRMDFAGAVGVAHDLLDGFVASPLLTGRNGRWTLTDGRAHKNRRSADSGLRQEAAEIPGAFERFAAKVNIKKRECDDDEVIIIVFFWCVTRGAASKPGRRVMRRAWALGTTPESRRTTYLPAPFLHTIKISV